ncbi:eukaryotic peptide chain release factor subunit 3 [Enterocytozoon bieneusi H348]|nr:eukaryotic Peptide Chain Release Factor subunit 3 [Enterocytozoon bieneusi H348]EED41745.1 eukaryotic peptide chain release factor subunit 3 [Enterocytozoon bieneusi H348]EED41922.1 eukaryotic peptide chain release factor subunit 3 [Enterocytozoon bieneusi H348]EED42210.1 eukaryotic peptide chain release factor subunit 3 [Enterocytozoon bieneusi H348]EED42232.1 eukaryotic peptide chain release factor subunit 3 [Enterocytozoon bieneusi H348]|eukprot:XP_001827805.1 eukaryotic Peptide Chain Release Factor subunit 3 [Enterocytozoon bieneusi H348]
MYTSEKKKIKVAKKGEKTIVVFDLEDEVILPTNPSKEGRIKFSLRDEDITVGVGEIIKGK